MLWFLRNPADPEEHPFRDLVDEPLVKHTRRLILSLLLYAPLTMLLVRVPVLLIRSAVPSLLPLRSACLDPLPPSPLRLGGGGIRRLAWAGRRGRGVLGAGRRGRRGALCG